MLYEAVTGKDRLDFPELPADWRTRPDFDQLLECNEILTHACDAKPSQRYQSAAEMCSDLLLLDRSQSVKRKRTTERRLKIVKRICAATALLALIAAALLPFLRGVSLDTSNPSYRPSKMPRANVEYREGVRCSSRDNKEGLAQALTHFQRAIEIDPNFTMAYNGLFEVYIGGVQLGPSRAEMWAKLRASATKLMDLDPKLAETQAAQAWMPAPHGHQAENEVPQPHDFDAWGFTNTNPCCISVS